MTVLFDRRALGLAAVLSALCTPSCAIGLSPVTTPPPTRTADLNDYDETLSVSLGVGLAFECWSGGQPCQDAVATTDDPRVARVYPAHLDKLVPDYLYRGNMTQQTGFVIVGITPGTTVLRLRVGTSDDEYAVTVSE